MHTWAIANQKGGVGKTTTTVALGGLLAAQGRRTVLVDMDPHASLSGYFALSGEDGHGSVYELFAQQQHLPPGAIRDMLRATPYPRLWVLPATPALATLDRQTHARHGMGLVLRQALAAIDFDYALIDCPPMLGVLMINALAACERLLIPTQTEFLALQGLKRMMQSLAMIEQSRRAPLPYTIIPTLCDMRTHASRTALRQLRETYTDTVSDTVVPTDTQVREASAKGVPASMWPAARRACPAYHLLLDEILAADSRAEAN